MWATRARWWWWSHLRGEGARVRDVVEAVAQQQVRQQQRNRLVRHVDDGREAALHDHAAHRGHVARHRLRHQRQPHAAACGHTVRERHSVREALSVSETLSERDTQCERR
jgi:hypothetical protein